MIGANHPFQVRSLNVLDENGNEGCASCGRPRDVHRAEVNAASGPGSEALAAQAAGEDPFGGHEFAYEGHTDLFRCIRCHVYEIVARAGDGPIEVNAW